jgi:hypothetical protein
MSAEVLYRGYKDWSFAQVGGEHFGLEQDDMDELFEKRGCGRARTADQAAAYIRNFVELNGGPKVVKS